MHAPLLLGIDLGTSAVKALLVDVDGHVAGAGSAECKVESPHALWSEQDPSEWWRAACAAIAHALEAAGPRAAYRVAAIGCAGQMHGLTLLDAHGATIRPCILWNDQRSAPQCDRLMRERGLEWVLRHTGNRLFPGFTLPKLLWVREQERSAFDRIARILLPKDWLVWKLTGEFASDVSDASGSAMFDVATRTWSLAVLEAESIALRWLPRVHESCAVVGALSPAAASATGLRPGTPVVAGAGDQAAAALGMGIVREGDVSVNIGTSGVVFAARDCHRPDPQGRLHAFCHAIPGSWHQMGVMLSAGGALRWFRDLFCDEEVRGAAQQSRDAYELIADLAAAVPAGCEGLTFLPYLAGERTPHADPDARAAFVGLTLRHTRAHLARAVFEGITFGLRDCLDLIRATGVDPERVRLAGGGARSQFWGQLCADIFGCVVEPAAVPDAGAMGAAALAAVGGGLDQSVPSAITRRTDASRGNPSFGKKGGASDVFLPSTRREHEDALRRYHSLYLPLREAAQSA